jgi:hypothetical protein
MRYEPVLRTIGFTEPEDAEGGFSLLIELDAKTESDARRVTEVFCAKAQVPACSLLRDLDDAKTESDARRVTEVFCAKAQVPACSLLRDLESGVDQYDVSAGWRDGPGEDAEHR